MNNTNHKSVEELFPWYVTGQLTAEERQLVEQEIEGNPDYQQELEYLRTLQQQIKQHENDIVVPSEIGLKRLIRDIKKENQTTKKSWWKSAIATAAAITIVLQTGIITHLATTGPDTGITPLSGDDMQGTVLQITFNPELSISALQTLLMNINGEIISGPSAIGLYHIRLHTESNEKIKTIISQLKTQTNAVTSVNQLNPK